MTLPPAKTDLRRHLAERPGHAAAKAGCQALMADGFGAALADGVAGRIGARVAALPGGAA